MKNWEKSALEMLENSLEPLPHEKNELDWKLTLSDNSERLKEHLSAFSNLDGGGILVFGVANDGTLKGVQEEPYEKIIQRLGNIARQGLEPSVLIDHAILEYKGTALLFVHIPESKERPVYIKGKNLYDSFTRVSGQTRQMSKQEVAQVIARSSSNSFEAEVAFDNVSEQDVLTLLDVNSYFDLLGKPYPENLKSTLSIFESEKLIEKKGDVYAINKLGAILFAKDLSNFDSLKRNAARVIIYKGKDRRETIKEQEGKKGYANGFKGLVDYINDQLPTNEVIGRALRKEVKMYPEIAIREIVANALIHQDFYSVGTGPLIEIFEDRIEITNPGKPIINTMRFIDSPPQSRNESLASFMRRLNICEERGSGVDKVIFEIEFFQLPAPEFIETENHLKVIMYADKPLTKMDKNDRIRACYQHACLKYVSGEKMSNQTIRKRMKIDKKNYPMASRIIADTIDAKLIKQTDPDSKSKKYITYIPFWA